MRKLTLILFCLLLLCPCVMAEPYFIKTANGVGYTIRKLTVVQRYGKIWRVRIEGNLSDSYIFVNDWDIYDSEGNKIN
jgi:hypothetical protein